MQAVDTHDAASRMASAAHAPRALDGSGAPGGVGGRAVVKMFFHGDPLPEQVPADTHLVEHYQQSLVTAAEFARLAEAGGLREPQQLPGGEILPPVFPDTPAGVVELTASRWPKAVAPAELAVVLFHDRGRGLAEAGGRREALVTAAKTVVGRLERNRRAAAAAATEDHGGDSIAAEAGTAVLFGELDVG